MQSKVRIWQSLGFSIFIEIHLDSTLKTNTVPPEQETSRQKIPNV